MVPTVVTFYHDDGGDAIFGLQAPLDQPWHMSLLISVVRASEPIVPHSWTCWKLEYNKRHKEVYNLGPTWPDRLCLILSLFCKLMPENLAPGKQTDCV